RQHDHGFAAGAALPPPAAEPAQFLLRIAHRSRGFAASRCERHVGPRNRGMTLDLLILGAGPAGCAAAMQARRAGLDVLLLDSSERPRPTPGETLHPGIEP